MKILISLFALSILTFTLTPSVAYAAKHLNRVDPLKAGQTIEYVGYDISYPQCGKRLPTDHYFAIVGVNGGTAASYNACLTQQLIWAKGAKTDPNSKQPKIQLYVNTANPAQDTAYNWINWPTTGNTPYGACSGVRNNDLACSWQYGWNRSVEAEAYFISKAQAAGISTNTSDYTWWLDVETMNSWQTGSGLEKNRAAIEGFAAYYQSKSENVGLYSTKTQWEQIVGVTLLTNGNLVGLPNWRPSGASLANAKTNCNLASLTSGGYILLTQYVVKSLDHNHSCI